MGIHSFFEFRSCKPPALAPIYVKSLAAGDRDSDLELPTPTSDGSDDADA